MTFILIFSGRYIGRCYIIQLFFFLVFLDILSGFPCGSDGKESACNVGDLSLIPGSGRSSGGGHGSPLQYSGLENPMNREEPGGLQSMGSQSQT